MSTFKLGYRPALDGLRALGILAIVAFHLDVPASDAGFLAVDLLLCLSGFLLSVQLAAEAQRDSIDLRHFYARRLVRLYPALLLLFALAAWTLPPAHTIAYLTQSANWQIIAGRVPNYTHVSHLWYLSVEWQLLAAWPPLLALLLRKVSRRLAVAVPASLALLAAVGRASVWHLTGNWTRVYLGTDTRADSFLLGAALGLAAAFGILPDPHRWRHFWRLATAAACLLPAYLLATGRPPAATLAYGGFTVAALASAVIIARLTACPSTTLSRALALPPLAFVGRISYGLYLWHPPLALVVKLLGLPGGEAPRTTLCVLLSFLAAGLSYRYIERPSRRLRARPPATRAGACPPCSPPARRSPICRILPHPQ